VKSLASGALDEPVNDRGSNRRCRIVFMYWGRRGLTQFVLELARAALADPTLAVTISVSRQNESVTQFEMLGGDIVPIDTFATNLGALARPLKTLQLRRMIAEVIARKHIDVVIDLMPHVWSSFIASAVRAAGARYVVIAHDADAHPGDYRSGSVKFLLDRAVAKADRVLTLSAAVTRRLIERRLVPKDRISTLFHPDVSHGGEPRLRPPPGQGEPMRLFFLGRIMPYKGLGLFLDAVDLLRADGASVEAGVFGEGDLATLGARLRGSGAEVINRWLSPEEISEILARCHAVVLSHTEASQSGIAAMALAAGVPVVATPVGGLVEQIQHGITGTIASAVDAPALVAAIKRLLLDPVLYKSVCANIAQNAGERSMARFVRDCVACAADSAVGSAPDVSVDKMR
jgi:glycosyltransferase involved in cell wall biosynthesis